MEPFSLLVDNRVVQAAISEIQRLKENSPSVVEGGDIFETTDCLRSLKASVPGFAKAVNVAFESIFRQLVENWLRQTKDIGRAAFEAGRTMTEVINVFCVGLAPIYCAFGKIPKISEVDYAASQIHKIEATTLVGDVQRILLEASKKKVVIINGIIANSNKLWDRWWKEESDKLQDNSLLMNICELLLPIFISASRTQSMFSEETKDWFDKQMNGKNLGGG